MNGIYITNTYHHIASHAQKKPDRPALICGDQKLSYHDFMERIVALAFHLDIISNASSPQKVLICCQDKINNLSAVFACFALQWVAIPYSPDSFDSLEWIADDCKADLLLCDAEVADRIRQSALHFSIPLYDLSSCSGEYDRNFTLPKKCRGNDMAMIIYSSGTTSGQKKGVIISYRILLETTMYMNKVMGIGEGIVEYVVAPIAHAFGFGRCRAVFYAGGVLVFDNGKFNPARILLSISKNKCNALSSVSTGIAAFIDYYETHLRKVGPLLKWVEIGSLPLALNYREKLLEILPNAAVFINFGLTEAMRSTFINLRKETRKIASVGKASPGVEVRILDDEGVPLSSCIEGEIAVKGVNLTPGYWNRKDAFTGKMKNGYFTTGDLGFMDEEGYLYFAGRKDDVINSGGKKFHPVEVENLLVKFFGHQNFCICGINDPVGRLGQVPVVCVEEDSKVMLEDIVRHLRPMLEDYMIPKDLFKIASMPMTDNGKVQRSKVVQRINAISTLNG
ncbi:MAG: acyl--CoA ligase [Deltaproteobacteria bacterium]|nr:acyl--CoA ligase [Deltaproteobacteria bacterium]